MKKYWFLLIALLVSLLLVACGGDDEGVAEDEEKIALAETFIQHLADESFDQATEYLDEEMSAAISTAELEQLWGDIQIELGAFIDQEYHSTEVTDDYTIVIIDGLFEANDVMFSVTINERNEISGFFIQ